MSTYKEKDRKSYRYEFQYKGQTYKGSTGQVTKEAADAYEFQIQDKVRRRTAGLTDLSDAPQFAAWAGVYYDYKATSKFKVKRPDEIDFLLRTTLKFWGRKPSDAAKVDPDAPYHDLTLADPITDPEWLDEFEDWMTSRGFSGTHRNHLRTQISGMYRVAMLPKHRKTTGVTMNPMVGVPRDRRVVRTAVLTPTQIVNWIRVAAYHVRLAIAIGALAPKLRMSNVLSLEWNVHLDRGLTKIRIDDHKTDATSPPIVVMVTEQLRDILQDARRRNRGPYVVSYRGRRVKDIADGVKAAALRAHIPYGRKRLDGVTFHTIRHAVTTLFAMMRVDGSPLSEAERAALSGHADLAIVQDYTHLNPVHELAPLEVLSTTLPIAAMVKQPWRRWNPRLTLAPAPGGLPGETPITTTKNANKSKDSAR